MVLGNLLLRYRPGALSELQRDALIIDRQVLLRKNAKVYLAARNKTRAEAAIKSLKSTTGKEAIFLEIDLADLDSIKRAVDEFTKLVSCLFLQ